MQRIQARAVRLQATQTVELDQGVILPPGFYTGTEWSTGLETVSGGVSWTAPQYKIEFTPDQLAKMGARVALNLISSEIDVTKFVRSGELTAT
jgi:hypothetical protein